MRAAERDEIVERVASAFFEREDVMDLDLSMTAAFVAPDAATVASSRCSPGPLPWLLTARLYGVAPRSTSPALLSLVALAAGDAPSPCTDGGTATGAEVERRHGVALSPRQPCAAQGAVRDAGPGGHPATAIGACR